MHKASNSLLELLRIGSPVIYLTVVGEDSIVRVKTFSANEESMASQEIDER